LPFENCCKPILDGNKRAPEPQALMRSRYSAYALKKIDYIYNTYAQSTKVTQTKADIGLWAQSVDFVKLQVMSQSLSEHSANEGFVEFIASYIQDHQLHQLHENSRFIIESGHWKYIDGVISPHKSVALGRNDRCPCDSDKKYKKCHG
jgi:SEC-C motif-containing protein